jgi:uncharacterized protein (DUF433 family)/transposase-like protein
MTKTIIKPLPRPDPRLAPLYTLGEAAAYLGLSPSTLRSWVHGYERRNGHRAPVKGRAIIDPVGVGRGRPTIAFVGLVEGAVLRAFREAGVPLQRIRPALERLKSEIGLEHALATKGVYTDGAEVLYDYARETGDPSMSGLVVVRNQQRVFSEILARYLKRISYGDDLWASRLWLPGFEAAKVIADPRRAFGRPIIESGRVRVEDVADRWRAGDPIEDVAQDYGLKAAEVEDVIRATWQTAA